MCIERGNESQPGVLETNECAKCVCENKLGKVSVDVEFVAGNDTRVFPVCCKGVFPLTEFLISVFISLSVMVCVRSI